MMACAKRIRTLRGAQVCFKLCRRGARDAIGVRSLPWLLLCAILVPALPVLPQLLAHLCVGALRLWLLPALPLPVQRVRQLSECLICEPGQCFLLLHEKCTMWE